MQNSDFDKVETQIESLLDAYERLRDENQSLKRQLSYAKSQLQELLEHLDIVGEHE